MLAACSGLLCSLHCTPHHEVIHRLKSAEPTAILKENCIFVEDRGICTSAGITAGIDLALHLIQRLCSPRTALATGFSSSRQLRRALQRWQE